MSAPVTLPRLRWGSPTAPRHALLVHGLGSLGALMWRFGVALTDPSAPGGPWSAAAVDLRGHGDAPRALDYGLAAYGADLAATTPEDREPWDLVIGHSLGAAAAVLAAQNTGWARRLVLVDPAIRLSDHDRGVVRRSQSAAFADPSVAAVRADHPHWHEHDIELKARAAQLASAWAVEQTSTQNPRWDVTDALRALTLPVHVLGSDPKVYSIFDDALARSVLADPAAQLTRIPHTGHSPHRDRPEETVAVLYGILRSWHPEEDR